MRFRKGARLDPGQVIDARGSSGGRGMGIPVGVGGGGVGIVILIAYLLITALSGQAGGLGALDGSTVGTGATDTCKTSEDANSRQDCRIVGDINSIQAYWQKQLGARYDLAKTVFFT